MSKNRWFLFSVGIAVLAAVLLTVVPFAATHAEASVGDLRILGGERTIREGETVERNISVMGGELKVRKDAEIYGDITIFGGEAEFDQGTEIFGTIRVYGGEITVEGTVSEDIVVLGGEVYLKENAVVEGDVKTVGGTLNRSRGSVIHGEVIGSIVDDFEVEFDPEEIVAERRAHFFPFGGFRTVRSAFTSAFSFLTNFLLIAAAALLLAIFAPKHIAAAETYLNKNLGLSWFIGAALLLVAGGLAIMAIAVNKLAKIDTGDLLKAGLALSFLTTQMRGMMTAMDGLDLTSFKSTAIIGVRIRIGIHPESVIPPIIQDIDVSKLLRKKRRTKLIRAEQKAFIATPAKINRLDE